MPSFDWKNSPQLDGGEDAEKAFAEGDECGQQHHRVWREVVLLEAIEVEIGTEKAACRQAEATQAM